MLSRVTADALCVYRYIQVAAGLPSGTWLLSVAETGGADLTGIAAILASVAGVISALAGAMGLLRQRKAEAADMRADVLMELLLKALDEEPADDDDAEDDGEPPPRSRRHR